jgi:hypothetical protein
MAEVDRIVPAKTQQRYVSTDTRCTGSGSGLITTNCTSTPVYETIILNQAERDTAYNQCRARTSSQSGNVNKNSQFTPPTPQPRLDFSEEEWNAKVEKNKQTQAEVLRQKFIAENNCLRIGLTPNTSDFNRCVLRVIDSSQSPNKTITSNTMSSSNPSLKIKLSADTPLCIALAKSDGKNSDVYKSQCSQ